MEPITRTAAATPIADRIKHFERDPDGSILEMEFTDDRGEPAQICFVDGAMICKGRAGIFPDFDSSAECGFQHREEPTSAEERALLEACARTPKGVEMAFTTVRTFVEATIMKEVLDRIRNDGPAILEYCMPAGAVGSAPESPGELEAWYGDYIRPFQRSAAFGRAAERTARAIWLGLMATELQEEKRARVAAARAKEGDAPYQPRVLH